LKSALDHIVSSQFPGSRFTDTRPIMVRTFVTAHDLFRGGKHGC